ncbi:MAG: hypothetical protein RL078_8, partial [Bacteroidota bacterium]
MLLSLKMYKMKIQALLLLLLLLSAC